MVSVCFFLVSSLPCLFRFDFHWPRRRVGALGDLHHEGRLALHEVREDLQVHGGAQVVAVGHEHVPGGPDAALTASQPALFQAMSL